MTWPMISPLLWKSWTLGALSCAAMVIAHVPARGEHYVWTQFTVQGLEVRVVTDAPACPAAAVDGTPQTMTVRAAPGPDYAVTTCALLLQPTINTLAIGDQLIPLPKAAPKRIAVIGDTGCRLKGSYIQACNDPVQWPFKQLAERLAADKPDLIIHVGDYHYRESPCPKSEPGCAGSPYGDTWDVWRADFFAPAATLLPVAPWVMVRGNHEDCQRGGKGWSRALEPAAFDVERGCNGPTPLYAVRLPNVTLAVVDTALAREEKVDPKQVDLFREQYVGLAKLGADPIWLLQHRPIWSAGGTVAGFPFGDNKTLAAAARTTLPPTVMLMLSGHHHIFQALNYADGLPPQIVSGHGGDYLNTGNSLDPTGWSINGVTVTSGLHDVGTYGYLLMEPVSAGSSGDGGWGATNFDVAGKPRHRCTIMARQVICRKA
jgi:Calcineurin-like phosphoesterase